MATPTVNVAQLGRLGVTTPTINASQQGRLGVTSTPTGTPDISQMTLQELYEYDPGLAQVAVNIASLGFTHDEAMSIIKEQARQADMDNAYKYWALTAQAESDEKIAAMTTGASRANAQASAAANRYAADQALKASQASDAAKIKIAAMDIAQRAAETLAELKAHPGDWVEAAYRKRGEEPPTAQTAPAAQQAQPSPWAAYQGRTAYQPNAAIVGERGPELAQQTAQGTRITPLSRMRAQRFMQQGVQGMQRGGMLGGRGWALTRYGQGDNAWQAFQQQTPTPAPAQNDFYNKQPWLEMLRTGQKPARFQGWKFAETGAPELGIQNVPPPTQVTWENWIRLDPDEREQALSLWRSVYNLTPEAAEDYIRRASFFGTGQQQVAYG
jgi:hypothetical protein